MDSNTQAKIYHIHGMDSRDYSDSYFSDKEDMVFGDDSLRFPMMNLHYQFSSGRISGNFLIDITMGSLIHCLYSACKSFQEIVLLKFNEKCILELSRWLHDRTGAYDWTHTATAAAEMDGERDKHHDKETDLKSCIKQIVKCNFEEENITSPVVLPLADCVYVGGILEAISKNEDDCMKNLEKMLKLLKPGGHLILVLAIGGTYMVVAGERIHLFKIDENFLKNALTRLGLVIDYCAVQRRRNVSDLTDYKSVMCIVTYKEK